MTPPGGTRTRGERFRWALILSSTLLLAMLLTYVVLLTRKADPDMFWHVAVGEWVVEHRAVPDSDAFSWYGAENGSKWLAQEWLSDVIFHWVHRLGGFRAVFAFVASLAGTAFLLAYSLALQRTGRRMTSLIVATALAAGMVPYLAVRPQMFTYCLLLLLMLMLEQGRWWAAAPIVLLAVNLHGGVYPVYLVIVAFYALPKAWAAVAASSAAVLLNPGGVKLLAVPFRGFAASPVQEFQPTALIHYPLDLAVFLVLAILLARSRRDVCLRDGALALAFTGLAFMASRHVVFLYLVVVPLLSPYLVPADSREECAAPRRLQLVMAGTLAAAVLYLGVSALRPPAVERGYPAGALAYLSEIGAEHVLNDYHDGGYMIYRGVPPFIDGRGDPYLPHSTGGVNVFGDWADALGRKADLEPFLAKYDIRWILVGKEMPFYRMLDHNELVDLAWQDRDYAVFRVGGSVVATPSAPPTSATASR